MEATFKEDEEDTVDVDMRKAEKADTRVLQAEIYRAVSKVKQTTKERRAVLKVNLQTSAVRQRAQFKSSVSEAGTKHKFNENVIKSAICLVDKIEPRKVFPAAIDFLTGVYLLYSDKATLEVSEHSVILRETLNKMFCLHHPEQLGAGKEKKHTIGRKVNSVFATLLGVRDFKLDGANVNLIEMSNYSADFASYDNVKSKRDLASLFGRA